MNEHARQLHIVNKCKLRHKDTLPYSNTHFFFSLQVLVPILNWIAPCTLSTDVQDKQAQMLSSLLHMSDSNLAMILTPLCSYKKNTLWMLEHMMQKNLAQRSLAIDRIFGLQFREKLDLRDKRPLMYRGRFATAAHVKDHESIWKKVSSSPSASASRRSNSQSRACVPWKTSPKMPFPLPMMR